MAGRTVGAGNSISVSTPNMRAELIYGAQIPPTTWRVNRRGEAEPTLYSLWNTCSARKTSVFADTYGK
jgi:hypothetical protein